MATDQVQPSAAMPFFERGRREFEPSEPTSPALAGEVLPFSLIDEAVYLLDDEVEPWSVQIELGVPGRLDERRLRSALAAAARRHPLARVRKAPRQPREKRFHWKVTSDLDLDPLRVVDCPDEESLATVRSELHSLQIPLAESPPFRLRLAHHRGGDLLMLNMSHVAADAFGGLRLLTSLARAYAGQPDPLPELDRVAIRNLSALLGAQDLPTRLRRYLTLVEKLRDAVATPARIARDGGTARAGYGFHQVQLTFEQTQALTARQGPGTVNDALLAALNLAIQAWNDEHGLRTDRVSVIMPVNLRPKTWREEMVGNFSLNVRVSTSPQDRSSPQAVLQALVRQTQRIKKGDTAGALIEVLKRLPSLPTRVKRLVMCSLLFPGQQLVDTALLSNLGKLDEVPSFGGAAGEVSTIWFSAPAKMPQGLSIGVATVAGRLDLMFRYRHALFGRDAVRRFADLYLEKLTLVVTGHP